MSHLWHRSGNTKNQFGPAIDQHEPLCLDWHWQENQNQAVVWPGHAVRQQQSEYSTGCPNGRIDLATGVLHQQLNQTGSQYANQEVIDKPLASPQPFHGQTEHPDGKHVEKQVVKTTVQESVTEQLPGLKVTTAQRP